MLLPNGPRSGPMGGPPPQAVTDQDGRFVFDRLRPGAYTIAVEKTGYAAPIGPSNARRVEVAAGQSIEQRLVGLAANGPEALRPELVRLVWRLGWLTSMWRCGTSAIAWPTRSPTRSAQR